MCMYNKAEDGGRVAFHIFSLGRAISASLQKSLDSMKTDNLLGSEIGACFILL